MINPIQVSKDLNRIKASRAKALMQRATAEQAIVDLEAKLISFNSAVVTRFEIIKEMVGGSYSNEDIIQRIQEFIDDPIR